MKRFLAIIFAASLMPLCALAQKGGASSSFGNGSGSGGSGGAGTVTNVGTSGGGIQGGPITSSGSISLKINSGGGLSAALGTGVDELGVAALGITNAMLAGSITDDKLSTISTAGKISDAALSVNVTLGGNTFSGTGGIVRVTGATLSAPTIADLTNATHTHQNAAGGGQLNATSVFSAGTVPVARLPVMVGDGGSGGTAGIAPAPATGDATKCLSGAATYVACSGGGAGTPGGSNTQIQYNNSGSLGGISSFTVSGTTITQTGRFNLSPTTGATVGMIINQASSPTADPLAFQWGGTTWAGFTQRRTLNLLALNPATTSDGDIWSSSDQRALQWNKSGNTFAANLTYWVSTATQTISNSTKASLSGTGGIPSNANKTIPADFLVIGKAVCFEAEGTLTTSASPPNLTVSLENAAGVLATTGVQTPPANLTNRGVTLKACFTVRGAGASGTVFTQGAMFFRDSASNAQMFDMPNTSTTTLDTTIGQTPDLFAVWSSTVGGNSIAVSATRFYVVN